MNQKIIKILSETASIAGENFSGIGIIVWNEEYELPIFPIKENAVIPKSGNLSWDLAKISTTENELHDGFHILTPTLKLVRVSQYFSPPIIHGISVNRERSFGGRYLAALFGSALPGVKLSAIATPSLGIAVFENGQETYFEEP
ncbi:hypothetical protein D3C77_194990 [compost metagenome]